MDYFDNLFQSLTRSFQFGMRRRPRGRIKASLRQTGTRTEVSLGADGFFLNIDDPSIEMPATFDFVVPALAALSASRNIEIEFDQPVSQSLATKVEMMRLAYHIYCLSSIAEPRLILTNIVPDPAPRRTGQRILCMSGGVDSTCAAVTASQEHGYTHGLLIAGADYPSATHPGFRELRERVQRIADRLGLKLIVAETNLRQCGIEWELTHGFLLASMLGRTAGSFEEGAIGLDSGLANDFIMHPWGSSSAVFELLSTPSFPIRAFNRIEWRSQKVAKILGFDPALLETLSVCWKDNSTAGNCGTCFKCLRTRVALDALGYDGAHLFRESPPLMAFPKMMKVPHNFRALRTAVVAYTETHHHMREGPEKEAVGRVLKRLHKAYVRRMPFR